MTGTIDLGELLVKAQQQRKKYAESIDAFYLEVEKHAQELASCLDEDDLWQYRDRIEELRALAYKLRRSAARNLAEIEDNYRDSIRIAMANTKNTNGLHFSEREAKYEMQFITEYKIINNLQRMVEDLDKFSRYLEGRLLWIKDRQRFLQSR